jgi:hypothetical protein
MEVRPARPKSLRKRRRSDDRTSVNEADIESSLNPWLLNKLPDGSYSHPFCRATGFFRHPAETQGWTTQESASPRPAGDGRISLLLPRVPGINMNC